MKDRYDQFFRVHLSTYKTRTESILPPDSPIRNILTKVDETFRQQTAGAKSYYIAYKQSKHTYLLLK